MKIEMDPLASHIANTATKILVEHPEVAAMAISVVDQPGEDLKLVMVPIPPFETQQQKRISFSVALTLARFFGSRRLLALSDAWMVELSELPEDGGYPKPSDHPDRKEGLMLTDCTELGVKLHTMVYSRDEDGVPIPGEWRTLDSGFDGMIADVMTTVRDLPEPTQEEVAAMTQLAALAGTSVNVL